MRRREALSLIVGAVITCHWSPAQPAERVRGIGVLIALAENDAEIVPRIAALERGLRDLGWIPGQSVRVQYRFASGSKELKIHASELVASKPDVIVASSGVVVLALQRESRTIPIVFVTTSDPIGDGLLKSLARPDGNATGFTNSLATMGGKWVEILKQAAPNVAQVGIIYNPDTAPSRGAYFLPSFEAAAKLSAVKPVALPVQTESEIEQRLTAFARTPNSGLIVMPDNFTALHRQLIIEQVNAQRLPATYPFRYFATGGGLISYGPDLLDLYRRTPLYVDRILRGAKVFDLPVQAPAKFELVVNLKAAATLGLTVPRVLLARADEVLE
jgi:ABC-type uncharacterized transport system substrate-binding protein